VFCGEEGEDEGFFYFFIFFFYRITSTLCLKTQYTQHFNPHVGLYVLFAA